MAWRVLCGVALCAVSALSREGPCPLLNVRQADLLLQQELQQGLGGPSYKTKSNVKHIPYLTVTGTTAVVTVGLGTVSGKPKDPVHPSVVTRDPKAVHFITTIYVTNQHDEIISLGEYAGTTDRPVLRFLIPKGTTSLTPFAFCNRHGLFKGDKVAVDSSSTSMFPPACDPAACMENTLGVKDGVCQIYAAIEAEALRRQVAEHQELLPFKPTDANVKHTPFISFTGTRAIVTVGRDPTHPVTVSVNPHTLHYIALIYVKDGNNKVVAAASLSPLDPTPMFHFNIPKGTRSLKAYALCNKHGLYEGPAEDVDEQAASDEPVQCDVTHCLGGPVIATPKPKRCESEQCEADV